ncbi:MAG: double zinc ribbon domain-containing protein [Chloroflexota bacterium]
MAKETLGYIKLEWTCPRCNSRNPGPQKTCLSCGAPQPENVQFHAPENQELVKDEAEISQAKKGADIHCPYCGARNTADAQICAQCGGDIKGGEKRQAGAVVSALSTLPEGHIACPNCAALNPSSALKCQTCGAPLPANIPLSTAKGQTAAPKIGLWVILVSIMFFLACLVLFIMMTRTKGLEGQAIQAFWESQLSIESLRPVQRQAWAEEVPPQAENVTCTPKVHHVQEEPAENANKICGTSYVVDTGSGYGEVVQDCKYEVLMDYCQYTVMEWQTIETVTQKGDKLPAMLPSPSLERDQRAGNAVVHYACVVDSSEGQFTYTTTDETFFRQCSPGSKWILELNGFGQLVNITPK